MEVISVEKLEEFDKIVAMYRTGRSHLVWRGQANASWILQSSLERFLRAERIPEVESYPFTVFFSRLQNVAHFLGKFSGLDLTLHKVTGPYGITVPNLYEAEKYWDDLVLLRHHGFPSFWLDWTQSPWIALYFAFEPASDCDRAVFVHSSFSEIRSPPRDASYHIITKGFYATEPRHSIQQCHLSCAYRTKAAADDDLQSKSIEKTEKIVYEQDIVPFETAIKETSRENQYTKVILPAALREEVLRRLAEYNVNHFTLFGNPESAIRTAALNSFVLNYLTL